MKMAGAAGAIIDPEKIRDYLLSPTHPVGRFKAAFFAALGYKLEKWPDLQRDLKLVANVGSVREGPVTAFGSKFEVSGVLIGPSGRAANVVTAWIIRHGENFPRFITAYPGEPS